LSSPARSPVAIPPSVVISPRRNLLDWRLGELWQCRDLILLFVRRDFVAIYKQTILGPAWHILRPLLTTLTFTVVFGRWARLPTDGAPPFAFYLAGQVLWSYFATSFDQISRTFIINADLLGKVYFHRLAIPVSNVLSNLISLAIQFLLLMLVLLAYHVQGESVGPTTGLLLVPILLLMVAGYALGAGIIVCALTTRYRDLIHLVTFGVQLLMFVTPVIYPVSSIPSSYRWIVYMNPLTPLFEAFRLAVLGVGSVTFPQFATAAAGMVVVLFVALMLFTRVERVFMDTV
jgi:lipopolysaccharide transport system permease protein